MTRFHCLTKIVSCRYNARHLKKHPLFLGGVIVANPFFCISPVLFLCSDLQGETSANGSANIS